MLQKHDKFMHLLSDEAINGMGFAGVTKRSATYKQNVETIVCDELKVTQKMIQ